MPEEKTYPIPESLLNMIVTYLGHRPYVEVAPIINQIAAATMPPRVRVGPVLVPSVGKVEGKGEGEV